jgi:hypothetical protein
VYSDEGTCPNTASASNPACAADSDCAALYGGGYKCVFDDMGFCAGGRFCANNVCDVGQRKRDVGRVFAGVGLSKVMRKN